MAQHQSTLFAAGNTEVPAYLTLIQKGYILSIYDGPTENEEWVAEKDGLRFQGNSLIELLGLVSMVEVRGANWAATDKEIDDFLKMYEH